MVPVRLCRCLARVAVVHLRDDVAASLRPHNAHVLPRPANSPAHQVWPGGAGVSGHLRAQGGARRAAGRGPQGSGRRGCDGRRLHHRPPRLQRAVGVALDGLRHHDHWCGLPELPPRHHARHGGRYQPRSSLGLPEHRGVRGRPGQHDAHRAKRRRAPHRHAVAGAQPFRSGRRRRREWQGGEAHGHLVRKELQVLPGYLRPLRPCEAWPAPRLSGLVPAHHGPYVEWRLGGVLAREGVGEQGVEGARQQSSSIAATDPPLPWLQGQGSPCVVL
mmetsp:Transcript_33484/g.96104  ORF Transcript_33484/g.96104 Transcript_33484/m.96104 type:complete len:274 (-) Transcript_33484:242-1063(-)